MAGKGGNRFLALQVPQFDGLVTLAEAKVKPSGLNATLLTHLLWPARVAIGFGFASSTV
jgi:hypothetical protein